jgi:basic amino acid/polyamine antiporter, APA family
MEAGKIFDRSTTVRHGKLLRVLGIGFGLAIAIGATIGVGILRNPGGVAAYLGSYWWIIFAWVLGGVYCMLGANYLAELATMTPKAGGFYVHSHRAFGDYGGFLVGWSDWANGTLGLGFISVVFGEYAAGLFLPGWPWARVVCSVSVLVIVAFINSIGVRSGSGMQKATSLIKAVALLAFVVACFAFGGGQTAELTTPVEVPTGFFAGLTAFVLAFQIILATYDGYYQPIYFAEEDTNPSQNITRSMFGGIAIITAIYVLVNAALLYVLPMAQMASSTFAGGDAMSLIFGERAGQIVTVLALLSLIGIINALMMAGPRVMFALGRDGLFTRKADEVNAGGTPSFALIMTALSAVVLTVVGTFDLLLAIGQFLIVVIMIVLVVALFVLRRREPDAPRPYRTWGYPFAPLLMLLFAVLLFIGYCISNPFPSAIAAAALILSYPLFRLLPRLRRSTL